MRRLPGAAGTHANNKEGRGGAVGKAQPQDHSTTREMGGGAVYFQEEALKTHVDAGIRELFAFEIPPTAK